MRLRGDGEKAVSVLYTVIFELGQNYLNSTSPILDVFPSVTFSSFLNRDACKFMRCKAKERGTAEGEICCYEGAQDFRSRTNSIRVLTLPILAFITVVSKRNGTLPVRKLLCTKGSAIAVSL
jgi:hypothetical protein